MLFLVIIALAVVAFASNMTYQQQTIVPALRELLQNKPFEELLSKIEVTYWGETLSVETRGYYYFLEFLIRKATHFTGYGVIALIFFFFYRKLCWRPSSIFAIISVIILASFDEIRQSYKPGRTGIFDDVLIDTAGAFTFILVVKIFFALKHRWKPSYNSKS
ncbi:VanZ family protein [Solibacillus sp. FSL H8-0538]|uniref:VanZ family protein n=1 Tax=Solibacillus sp. FSL H8-0538 TaxID=2921400 RepID=UPI0030FA7117